MCSTPGLRDRLEMHGATGLSELGQVENYWPDFRHQFVCVQSERARALACQEINGAQPIAGRSGSVQPGTCPGIPGGVAESRDKTIIIIQYRFDLWAYLKLNIAPDTRGVVFRVLIVRVAYVALCIVGISVQLNAFLTSLACV